MKKTFTLMMTLCLVASAFAASKFEVKQKSQPAPQQQQLFVAEPMMTLSADIDKQKLSDLSNCPFKVYATNPDMVQQQAEVPAIRKAGNADPTAITINGGYALYLGTYYYLAYESSVPLWEICLTSAAKDTIWLDFYGYSSKYIEGMYKIAGGQVVLKGATEKRLAKGDLSITYKSAGTATTSPTYSFKADLVDVDGNEYSVSGDYAFVNDPETAIEVIDLGYYQLYFTYAMYCEFYKVYCEETSALEKLMLIALQDAPVTPTGISKDIDLKEVYSQRYDAGSGYWYVYGQNDSVINMLGYYADYEYYDGDYNENNFYRRYTRLAAVSPDTTIEVEIYKPQELVVTRVADTVFYEETLLGRDGNTYNVSMYYVNPNSEDTVTIPTAAVGNYDDYIESDGILMATAMTQDGAYFVNLGVYTNQAVGTYTTKDLYSTANYIATLGKDTVIYLAVADTIQIIKATGQAAETCDYLAYITMLGRNQKNPQDVKWFKAVVGMVSYYYMDAAQDLETTFDENKEDVIQFTANQQDGYVALQAKKADGSDYFYGVIFPETLDQTYTLPIGVYPIDFSQDAPSMLASTGYELLSDGMYPTFYATIDNKKFKDLWFVVEGDFTVNGFDMILEGKNSNGNDVTINFKRINTALQNIASKAGNAAKMIVNGQLMIKKNGKLYNAQGAAVAE